MILILQSYKQLFAHLILFACLKIQSLIACDINKTEGLLLELFHWAEIYPMKLKVAWDTTIYFIIMYSLVTVITMDGSSFINLIRNNKLSA